MLLQKSVDSGKTRTRDVGEVTDAGSLTLKKKEVRIGYIVKVWSNIADGVGLHGTKIQKAKTIARTSTKENTRLNLISASTSP